MGLKDFFSGLKGHSSNDDGASSAPMSADLLLHFGADVNYADNDGDTPIMKFLRGENFNSNGGVQSLPSSRRAQTSMRGTTRD